MDRSNIRTTNGCGKVILSAFSLCLSRYMSACVNLQSMFIVKSMFLCSLAAVVSALLGRMTESVAQNSG